jgi:Bacterial protein of unknown function (DUF885)
MRASQYVKSCVAACATLIIIAACSQPPPPKPTSSAAWDKMSSQFVEDTFKAQPFEAVQLGRHEFDGQMPDLSADGIAKEISRLHAARKQFENADLATMSTRQQFQREYLLSTIDNDLFWLEKAQFPFRNPAWYLDHIDPDVYLSREYAPLDVRLKGYIGYAKAIPQISQNIRANLRTPLPKAYVEYAIKNFGGFVDFYAKDVPPIFKRVRDEALQKQLVEVSAAASKSMAELRDWFMAQRKTANDTGYVLGRDLMAAMVKDADGVDAPLADIEAAGKADLQRNLDALKAACDQYAPKTTLAACVAKEWADKPKLSAVAAAQQQLDDLRAFVKKNDIVTIPSSDPAKVVEAPPYNRGNFAFIQTAGPYDQGVAYNYNIAPADPTWSAAVQANYVPGQASLLFTSVHEVWPGHYLQFLHSNSNAWKPAGIWVNGTFAEGWAHYAEEMMWDMGLGPNDPETHIGQLENALLRNVRLLSSIGLHTEGLTVAQSEKMFREQGFQDIGNAKQQALRGTYDPDYLCYTLGKLMIRRLRADWLDKHGYKEQDTRKHWKQFHDEFLSYGGPPIPLVRKQMIGVGGTLF